jgi:hypothetical protein
MPSTLQYIKLVNDLNEVLGIGEENETWGHTSWTVVSC